MDANLHIVCAACAITNRVPRDRLAAKPRCGACKQALISDQPFELTGARVDRYIAGNDLPVVIDFWASWCGPCRMMAPSYEKAAAELAPDVLLAKLNIEEAPDISARFAIQGIPTLIAFRNGREVSRQSGAMNLVGLVTWIKGAF